jgi:hypothetical protein
MSDVTIAIIVITAFAVFIGYRIMKSKNKKPPSGISYPPRGKEPQDPKKQTDK